MKHASSVMNKIGRIFNIVELVLTAILVVLGAILLPIAIIAAAADKEAAVGVAGAVGYLVWGLVLLALSIVTLVLAKKANAALANGRTDNGPHILLIVGGAISGNVFYVLAGIFGLVGEHTGNNEEAK